LAKEIQKTIQSLATFSGNPALASGTAAGLSGQIDELERSVPELTGAVNPANPAPPANASSTPAAPTLATASLSPDARGILGLISDVFTLRAKEKQLADLQSETDALVANLDRMRGPLVNDVRQSINRADQIGASQTADGNAES